MLENLRLAAAADCIPFADLANRQELADVLGELLAQYAASLEHDAKAPEAAHVKAVRELLARDLVGRLEAVDRSHWPTRPGGAIFWPGRT